MGKESNSLKRENGVKRKMWLIRENPRRNVKELKLVRSLKRVWV